MLWEQVLLAAALPDVALIDACTQALPIAPDRVIVVPDIADAPPPGPTTPLLIIERRPVAGQFPLGVTLYVEIPEAQDALRDREASRDLLISLCRRLGVDCLIADDDPDPYSMLLVRPDGQVIRVDLDGAQLDEHDAYVLSDAAPVGSVVPEAVPLAPSSR